GLPLNMDGSVGPQAEWSQAFAGALRAATTARVELVDERLSSFQADELMEQAGVPSGQRAARRDAFAAQVILMAFLARGRSAE
ncbi:MAG: Holliday junction resolvase RuvX, partial [Phycisphaerales bacterium]|nr:Holliday junction resolvase RuvX [Phycisphaerales bacterium]